MQKTVACSFSRRIRLHRIDLSADSLRARNAAGTAHRLRFPRPVLREWRHDAPFPRRLPLIIAAAVSTRLMFLFLYRIDSDEPQHLHVVWAWSRGLVQYRDVFDNHFPLLHLLFAPLMAVLPEHSSVLLLMRLAIFPFAIGASGLLYRLGGHVVGTPAAVVAAVLFSVMPPWLPKSVEFRNDTLWIFFWLAALVFLVRTRPAFILAGFAAGLCLLASVKAAPVLLAHLFALLSTRQPVTLKNLIRFSAGAAVPLFAIAAFMLAQGALDDMLYGTLRYNASLPVDPVRRVGGWLALALIAPPLLYPGRKLMRGERRELPRHLIFFALWYVVLIVCLWPRITTRDFLPLVPVAALALATLRIARLAPAVALMLAALGSLWYARLWRPSDLSRRQFIDAAVQWTAPYEAVFDLKGDAVFRRRAVRPIYEHVGRELTRNGTIRDLGPELIAARGCCLAIADSAHIPERTRAFLNQNFLDLGPARVCGTVPRNGAFTIAVPQVYAVLARHPSRVIIDHVPYRGPRFLAAGRHSISTPGNEPATILWWRAARR